MLHVNIEKELSHFILDVEFTVQQEIDVLLGAPRYGKQTILDSIAGRQKSSHGLIKLRDRVLFDGKNNNSVPIQHRKIGYVFQDYALFPHLTVWENIAYGMKNKTFAIQL